MPNWLYEAMAVGIVNGAAFTVISVPLYFIQRYLSKRSAKNKAGGDQRQEKLLLDLHEEHSRKINNTIAFFGTVTVAACLSYLTYFLVQLELFLFAILVLLVLAIGLLAKLRKRRAEIIKNIEKITSEIHTLEIEKKKQFSKSNQKNMMIYEKNLPVTNGTPSNSSNVMTQQMENNKEKLEVFLYSSKGTDNICHPLEEAFSILLAHDEEVKAMIDSASGLPTKVKQDILSEVLSRPGEDIKKIRDSVILKALGRSDMSWNEEFDAAMKKFKNADPENVEKFFKAFPVLSHRMSIKEIFNKVIFLPESVFYVQTAGGRDVKVTQKDDDIFELESLISGVVALNSLEEVFDYLGTPENRRYRKKSW